MEHSFTSSVRTAQPSNAHLAKQYPEQPQAPSKDVLRPHLFHLCAWYKASICRSGQISCPPELCSSFTKNHKQQRWAPLCSESSDPNTSAPDIHLRVSGHPAPRKDSKRCQRTEYTSSGISETWTEHSPRCIPSTYQQHLHKQVQKC